MSLGTSRAPAEEGVRSEFLATVPHLSLGRKGNFGLEPVPAQSALEEGTLWLRPVLIFFLCWGTCGLAPWGVAWPEVGLPVAAEPEVPALLVWVGFCPFCSGLGNAVAGLCWQHLCLDPPVLGRPR